MWPFRLVLVTAIVGWPSLALAIQISEIAYDLAGSDSDREWIEVFNETDQPVDLTGWLLVDDSNHKLALPPEKGGQGSLITPPGQYLILADNASQWLAEHPDYRGSVIDTVINLPNYQSQAEKMVVVKLVDLSATIQNEISFQPTELGRLGYTWERQLIGEWQNSSRIGGTPGRPPDSNSISYSSHIRLSEIMSNPEGLDIGREWIEVFNGSDQTVDLTSWSIVDKAMASDQTNQQLLPSGTNLEPFGYYQFKLAGSILNNKDETVSLLWPNNQVVDSVDLAGPAPEGASWGLIETVWHWTSFPTPARPNQLVNIAPSPATLSSKPRSTAASPTIILNQSKVDKPTPVSKSPSPSTNRSIDQPTSSPIRSINNKSAGQARASPRPTELRLISSSPTVAGTTFVEQSQAPLPGSRRWFLVPIFAVLIVVASLVRRWQLIRRWPKFRALLIDDLIT